MASSANVVRPGWCARCDRDAGQDTGSCFDPACPLKSVPQRTIDAKIERLRQRLKDAPIDANVRAILLGILDLLGDEL